MLPAAFVYHIAGGLHDSGLLAIATPNDLRHLPAIATPSPHPPGGRFGCVLSEKGSPALDPIQSGPPRC
jgi:hypothetical protein